MLPYGIKKIKHKVHGHKDCDICCGQPPPNSKSGRRQGKASIADELKILLDDSTINFPCTVSEELDMNGVMSCDI